MNKTEALQRFDRSRQALFAAIGGLPETKWEQTGAEGDWGVRDLLAHIASWEDTVLAPLREFVQGGDFKSEHITDHRAWNQAQENLWRQGTLSATRQELDRIRAEILALVEPLDEARMAIVLQSPWGTAETLAQMISGLAWHEEEHTKSIVKWRMEKNL